MDPTTDELWSILQEQCAKCYRCCQNDKDAKAIYEWLGRMQEVAKNILSKS